MTSKLEKYLATELYTRFDCFTIKQNYRPDWLEGLELDFYIEELKLAAEVQGEQHYKFVEHFHKTPEKFAEQQDRDYKKNYICRLKGVKIIEIFTEQDADLFISLVKDKTKTEQPKYSYSYERNGVPVGWSKLSMKRRNEILKVMTKEQYQKLRQ